MFARNRLNGILVGCTLALACAVPAVADDSEIYLSSTAGAAGVRPNILLIVDTSMSMDASDVSGEKVEYNRAKSPTYTNANNCNNDSRIFFRKKGDPMPTCTSGNYIDLAANNCDKMNKAVNPSQSSAISGRWTGKAAQYDSATKQWLDLVPGGTAAVECLADDDVHGSNAASTPKKYAQNGDSSNPWSSLSTNRINWAQRTTYTFYSSKWMNWSRTAATQTVRRTQAVENAVVNMLASVDDVNIGLMRFNLNTGSASNSSTSDPGYKGGVITNGIGNIDLNRNTLIGTATNNGGSNAMGQPGYAPNTATMLAETLFEAYRYWSGGAVWSAGSSAGRDTSIINGASNYISPITHQCQRNFNIILTDGAPTWDNDADAAIKALRGGANCDTPNPGDTGIGEANDGKCLDDLAGYLYNNDIGPPTGVQNVVTYTIGFGNTVAGATFLSDVATQGGGQRFDAANSSDLAEIFDAITADALNISTTFSSGTVSVNAFNRTESRDEVYFAVFAPQEKYRWDGNIKKYKVGVVDPDGTGPGKPKYVFTGQGTVADAVDPATGYFKDNALSFWSTAPADGARVTAGGAANKLPASTSRKIYTFLGANPGGTAATLTELKNLTTTQMDDATNLGTTSTNRQAVIDFAYAKDDKRMGDPMHSSPAVVTYGGTATSPVDVVFSTTNDGYLHAIDASTGVEKWSFIPKELLSRLKLLEQNSSVVNRVYGLDGDIRVLRYDKDEDGQIEPLEGDRVYLYAGMRRGGSWYYGMDVTYADNPKMLFKIGPSQLPSIGETWSPPTIARVKVGDGTTQNGQLLVLIFGGGYSAAQEAGPQVDDTVGQRVFMVDAKSGNLLWYAGSNTGTVTPTAPHTIIPKMTNSIPGGVSVLDLDGDLLIDRMYVADTGGRIFRLDVTNGNAASTLVTGGVFAELGQGGVAAASLQIAHTRRFYYAPDVTMVADRGAAPYINVAIGSGYRGHPLNRETIDRFYSLRDAAPFTKYDQTTYNGRTPIKDADTNLVDVTSDPFAVTVDSSKVGWKRRFEGTPATGEKVISPAISANGVLYYSSYQPLDPSTADPCRSRNQNRVYTVALATGRPMVDNDGDGDIDKDDVSKVVAFDGILGATNISVAAPALQSQYVAACLASGLTADCEGMVDTDGDGDIDADDRNGPKGGGNPPGQFICNTGPVVHGSCLTGTSGGRVYWNKPSDSGN